MRKNAWKMYLLISLAISSGLFLIGITSGFDNGIRETGFPKIRVVTLFIYSVFISWLLLLENIKPQLNKMSQDFIRALFLFFVFLLFAVSYEVILLSNFAVVGSDSRQNLEERDILVFSSGGTDIRMGLLNVSKLVFLIFGIAAYSVCYFASLVRNKK